MQSSNALNIMIAMVLARMSGYMNSINLVKKLQVDFKSCLPRLEKCHHAKIKFHLYLSISMHLPEENQQFSDSP